MPDPEDFQTDPIEPKREPYKIARRIKTLEFDSFSFRGINTFGAFLESIELPFLPGELVGLLAAFDPERVARELRDKHELLDALNRIEAREYLYEDKQIIDRATSLVGQWLRGYKTEAMGIKDRLDRSDPDILDPIVEQGDKMFNEARAGQLTEIQSELIALRQALERERGWT